MTNQYSIARKKVVVAFNDMCKAAEESAVRMTEESKKWWDAYIEKQLIVDDLRVELAESQNKEEGYKLAANDLQGGVDQLNIEVDNLKTELAEAKRTIDFLGSKVNQK